ncbi:RNA polymerase sigma factor [Actinoplanes derwentensis]|uniref:RNA polymerase sigma factor n=1 Tax=Actinoplanes derwentensis TaxID=113562 RepID=UPI001E2BBA3F|nr:RNA polymerase sigma factor [Actinoplanes derwentensis]
MTATMRARIRAGDADAFAEVFDEHAQAVYRHAVWTDGDHTNADDVVSLTFLEAWRIRETLRPDGDGLRPWLLGIATNVLRNRRRAARRHRAALARVPERAGDRATVPDFADEVVGRLYDSAQLAAAAAALGALRRADREVFLLCVWQELDYAAAAEALGIPIGTVRSRVSRARVRLRALAEAGLGRKRETTAPESTQEQLAPEAGSVHEQVTAEPEISRGPVPVPGAAARAGAGREWAARGWLEGER